MKIQDLLIEAKVTDITQANNSNRTYGADGYQNVLQALINKREIHPVDRQPTIKPTKQLRVPALTKALQAVGFELEEGESLNVSNALQQDPANVGVTLYLNSSKFNHMDNRLGDRARAQYFDAARARIVDAVVKAFGTYAEKIETGFGASVIVLVSPSYLEAIGFQKTPVVTEMIKAILRQQNIGGMNLIDVTRTSNGYSVRVQGAELVDEKSMKTLDMAMRQAFGDCYIKMKHDGEIDSIGHRPVSDGLTNYRFYFTHDLKNGRILAT